MTEQGTQTTRRRIAALLVVVVALGVAACGSSSASSTSAPPSSGSSGTLPPPPAVPHPFGKLSCVPQNGIRFCQGGMDVNGHDLRVPSFDGVPLDADVALPPTGKGPFPLIVLLHGLGESKTVWETNQDASVTTASEENDVALASRGWAVLMYTARGFGESCGTPASRAGTPACAKGWIQLADQRYEVRDTQYLAGMLVDEGLVRPGIAVSGVSYGGGQSLELAMLKNRVRLPNGKLVAWTSPVRHIPMSIAGAFALWGWDDLATALTPNGHLLTTGTTPTPAADEINPGGVPKQSWNTLLYGVTVSGYLSPVGADPDSDLTQWYQSLLQGEPLTSTDTTALHDTQQYKSPISIPMASGGPAPTAMQNGWTDTLFPASEAMQYAQRVTSSGAKTPLLQMFGDLGHGWAQNKPAAVTPSTRAGLAFLDAVVRNHTKPQTGVTASAFTCPASASPGPTLTGRSLASLQHGTVRITGVAGQTVTSAGGDPATASALNPAYVSGIQICSALPAAREPGTAVYTQRVGASPETLLGGPVITAHLHIVGNYPELVGRLWDVAPNGTTRQIVAMNVYRPSVNQAASTTSNVVANTTMTFELNPNQYTFAPGHTIELELVGSNAPMFQKSNGTFSVTVSHLSISIPTT